MQILQIIALIGIIIATYIYIVKTVIKNFKNSNSIASNLAWGFLMLLTLSFLFSSHSSSSPRYSGGGYGGGGSYYDDCDDFDCYDDCHHDFLDYFHHDDNDFDDDYDFDDYDD